MPDKRHTKFNCPVPQMIFILCWQDVTIYTPAPVLTQEGRNRTQNYRDEGEKTECTMRTHDFFSVANIASISCRTAGSGVAGVVYPTWPYMVGSQYPDSPFWQTVKLPVEPIGVARRYSFPLPSSSVTYAPNGLDISCAASPGYRHALPPVAA